MSKYVSALQMFCTECLENKEETKTKRQNNKKKNPLDEITLRIPCKVCKHFVLMVTFQSFFSFSNVKIGHFDNCKPLYISFKIEMWYFSQEVPFCKWFHF